MQYLIAVVFTAITFIIYKKTTDWLSIARINAFMWLFFSWIYILIYPYDFHSAGLIWIIFLCVAMTVGEYLGGKIKVNRPVTSQQTAFVRSIKGRKLKVASSLWLILLLIVLVALAASFIQLYNSGYNISVFFNFKKFLKMNAEIAKDRYNGDGGEWNILITLLSSFRYGGALLSGYLLNAANKKRYKLSCCLIFVPVLLDMAINNTKLGIISSLVLFVVGYVTGYMYFKGRAPKFTLKAFLILIAVVLALFVVLLFTLMVRQGEINGKTFTVALKRFGVYAVGHMESFNYWFSEVFSPGSYGLGVNTFMGPFSLFGIVEREQGVYGLIEGISTNVFTAYRGVISDWGVVGGLLVIFVIGFIGGVSKKAIINSGAMKTVYAAIAFTVLLSFIVSPWVYNSYWIAFIMFACVIGYNSLVVNREIKWVKKSREKSLR